MTASFLDAAGKQRILAEIDAYLATPAELAGWARLAAGRSW